MIRPTTLLHHLLLKSAADLGTTPAPKPPVSTGGNVTATQPATNADYRPSAANRARVADQQKAISADKREGHVGGMFADR